MTVALSPELIDFLAGRAPDLAGAIAAYLFALPAAEPPDHERFLAYPPLAERPAHPPLAPPSVVTELATRIIKWRDETRSALSRKECEREGGWAQSTQISKEDAGVLLSIRDGKKVLVTADSFHRHLIERIIASHPLDGPAKRGPATSTTFRKRLEAEA
jgi:hypothetical protein